MEALNVLATLESVKNTRREEIIHYVTPIKRALLELAIPVFDKFKRNIIQTVEGPFYTAESNYQIIGGDAIASITGKQIQTPDIDIEVAPVIDAKGSPVGFYRRIGPCGQEEVALPYVKYFRTRREPDESGEMKVIILSCEVYEVHPAYMTYMLSVRNELQARFTQMFQESSIQAFNAMCKPVDPNLDPETKHESFLSFDVGNFHFSFIINPHFISKIQLSVHIRGKAEHILELIFYKSKHSHFFPVLKPLEPVSLGGILVANPHDLLEQNIEAFVSRIYKKKQVDADFLLGKASDIDIIYINTKLYNTLDRIGLLLEKVDDERTKVAIEYLLQKSMGSNPFVIARLCDTIKTSDKEIQAILDGMCAPAPETSQAQTSQAQTSQNANRKVTFTSSAPPLPVTLSGKSKEKKKAKQSKQSKVQLSFEEEPWVTVSNPEGGGGSAAAAKSPPPEQGLPYFGEEDEHEEKPIKESAPPVPINLAQYTKPPLVIKQEDFNEELEEHLDQVGVLVDHEYYLIKETLSTQKPFASHPGDEIHDIIVENKHTLISILSYIETDIEKKNDFIFLYTLPSIHTALYYRPSKYEENIVYEEPSLHHIFKLFLIYRTLNKYRDEINTFFSKRPMREKEGLKKEILHKQYNKLLIVFGQIELRGLLSKEELAAFYDKFSIEFVKKSHTDDVTEEMSQFALVCMSKLIFNLLKKYFLTELFKYPTYQKVVEDITKGSDFLFKINTIRASIFNRQIRLKKKTHKGAVYIFCPYTNLVTDDKDESTRDQYNSHFYDAIRECKFRRINIPNPMYTRLSSTLGKELGDINGIFTPMGENEFCVEYNSTMFLTMMDVYNDVVSILKGELTHTDSYTASVVARMRKHIAENPEAVFAKPDNHDYLVSSLFKLLNRILLNDTRPSSVDGSTTIKIPILETFFFNIYLNVSEDEKMKHIVYLVQKIISIAMRNMKGSDILDGNADYIQRMINDLKAQTKKEDDYEGMLHTLTEELERAKVLDEFMSLIDTPNTAKVNRDLIPSVKLLTDSQSASAGGSQPPSAAAGGGGSRPPPQINNLDRKSRRKRKSNRRKTRRSKT